MTLAAKCTCGKSWNYCDGDCLSLINDEVKELTKRFVSKKKRRRMGLKQAIKNAVNSSQERYTVKQVHLSRMEEPQILDGHHTVMIELSVVPRKRKKK